MAQKQDWNQNWMFWKDGGQQAAQSVALPHDAMLGETRHLQTNNGSRTGYFPGGKYYYEKKFTALKEWNGKRVVIQFEGVYRHARVFLNGELLLFHANGYTPFEVDLTGKLLAGENTLLVEADNSYTPNSRWYSGSGIYRPVWLVVSEQAHLENVQIKTLSMQPAKICVKADITGQAPNTQAVAVQIYDGDTLVAEGGLGKHTIPHAKLWSAETPYLYRAVLRYGEDRTEERFGIRTIEADPTNGLRINGVETKLRGCCVHHDNGILGVCAFDDAEYRKAKLIKAAGYNAVRSAHNPCSRGFLDACDELGLYVMDELYDGWYTPKNYHDSSREFEQTWQDDVVAMVKKDYNHPSVIFYSTGNEVSEPTTELGRETAAALADAVRERDDTRLITCGLNVMLMRWSKYYVKNTPYEKNHLPDEQVKDESGSTYFNMMMTKFGNKMGVFSKTKTSDKVLNGAAAPLDVVGLNYGEARYDQEGRAGRRVIVGSETRFSDFWYNWPRVMKYKNIIGDFVWTGVDYLGETDIGNWRYPGQKGMPLLYGAASIDITGELDAQCYYQQVIWGGRQQPYIGVRPMHLPKPITSAWRMTDVIDSWTWQGHEGETAHVEVYTHSPRVRLYLNGRCVGRKKVKQNKAVFKVAYQPGKLEAVGFGENGGGARCTLITAGRETILQAQPEKKMLRANGQDLCYIPILLADQKGQLKPNCKATVRVEVIGSAASLAGFGSAQAITDERFDQTVHTTHQGRALAVLRAGTTAGMVQVRVSAKGFATQEFEVWVK